MRMLKFVSIGTLLLSACGPQLTAVAPTVTVAPATLAPALTETATPPGISYSLDDIQMFAAADGWAWASGSDSQYYLLHTEDGGLTWSPRSPSGYNYVRNDFFLDAHTAWLETFDKAKGSNGLVRTTDAGRTWQPLSLDLTLDPFIQFQDLENGWVETSDVGAGNAYVRFFETHDGGATWTPVALKAPQAETNLPPYTIHICNICGDFIHYDPARAIILHGDMATEPSNAVPMQISFNSGDSWNPQRLPLPAGDYSQGLVDPRRVIFFDDENGALAVTISHMLPDGTFDYSDLAIYRTADGGKTWSGGPEVAHNVAWFAGIQFLSAEQVIAPCGDLFCVSRDGGMSWQTVTPDLHLTKTDNGATDNLLTSYDFVSLDTGWAILDSGDGSSNLYKTIDGARTWEKVDFRVQP